jgi:hypothetical protein
MEWWSDGDSVFNSDAGVVFESYEKETLCLTKFAPGEIPDTSVTPSL